MLCCYCSVAIFANIIYRSIISILIKNLLFSDFQRFKLGFTMSVTIFILGIYPIYFEIGNLICTLGQIQSFTNCTSAQLFWWAHSWTFVGYNFLDSFSWPIKFKLLKLYPFNAFQQSLLLFLLLFVKPVKKSVLFTSLIHATNSCMVEFTLCMLEFTS